MIDYLTNDAVPMVRASPTATASRSFCRITIERDSLRIVTVPDNFNDLYSYPQGVLNATRECGVGRLTVTPRRAQ